MKQHKGYYSLIQFCPDPSRLEVINLGVLVYSPDRGRLAFLLTDSNQRIRKVFGHQDWTFIDRVRESVRSRLQSEKFETLRDLESFITKRANVVQLTPVRPLRIGDIDQEVRAISSARRVLRCVEANLFGDLTSNPSARKDGG